MRFILFLMIVCLTSCKDNRVYDNIIALPSDGWKANYSLHFDVDIKDAKKDYTLMYNVRFLSTYEYYNLYVRYQVLDSTGKLVAKKLQGMDLFDPKTGRPNGKGLGDKFDFDVISDKKFTFPAAGKYRIKVNQYMRRDPLEGIEAFGVKIIDPSNQ